MKHARGFTLLEAIVAMVIFTLVASTLYAWQATNMLTIDRVASLARREQLIRDALGVLRAVNPMQNPRGTRRVGDLSVHWRAQPITPEVEGKSQIGSMSAYNLRLYVLDVEVRLRDRDALRFQVRQTGYKLVRAVSDTP